MSVFLLAPLTRVRWERRAGSRRRCSLAARPQPGSAGRLRLQVEALATLGLHQVPPAFARGGMGRRRAGLGLRRPAAGLSGSGWPGGSASTLSSPAREGASLRGSRFPKAGPGGRASREALLLRVPGAWRSLTREVKELPRSCTAGREPQPRPVSTELTAARVHRPVK